MATTERNRLWNRRRRGRPFRFEPEQFPFGAQASLVGILHQLRVFKTPYSQFFSYGGDFRQSGFRPKECVSLSAGVYHIRVFMCAFLGDELRTVRRLIQSALFRFRMVAQSKRGKGKGG